MPQGIVSEIADGFGLATLTTGVVLSAVDKLQIKDINDYIILVTSLLGLLWLLFKIVNQRLERKKHKLDIEIKKLEIEKRILEADENT